jgi:hypothetical protein
MRFSGGIQFCRQFKRRGSAGLTQGIDAVQHTKLRFRIVVDPIDLGQWFAIWTESRFWR